MGYIRDTAFILRHDALREHDAWVSMYGLRHGKITGIARGHRRMVGKQIGHMEPLTLAEVMVAEGKRYDKIAVSRVIQPFHDLRSDLPKVVIVSGCLSLIDMLTRPGVADERLYRLLEELFQSVAVLRDAPSGDRAGVFYSWFSLRLLGHLGHVAPFSHCLFCRAELSDDAIGIPSAGGGACSSCKSRVEGDHLILPALTWKLLRVIQGASFEDIASLSATKGAFREANHFVARMLAEIPADGEPHGLRTISSVLA